MLIPLNVAYNLRHVPPAARDVLSMLTIRDVTGTLLFVHVAVAYLITLLVCAFAHQHWAAMVRLRHAWVRAPEHAAAFYARTLTVTHVPKRLQSDEGLRSVFESVQVPYPTTAVHIGRKVGRLPELIQYHNDTVKELEAVLVKYLKGGRIAKNRPTVSVGARWGCGGVKKDAIEFYTCVPPLPS